MATTIPNADSTSVEVHIAADGTETAMLNVVTSIETDAKAPGFDKAKWNALVDGVKKELAGSQGSLKGACVSQPQIGALG